MKRYNTQVRRWEEAEEPLPEEEGVLGCGLKLDDGTGMYVVHIDITDEWVCECGKTGVHVCLDL